jgi:hypothetical protein
MNGKHVWEHRDAISRLEMERIISYGTQRFMNLSILRESRFRNTENDNRRMLHRLLFDNWDALAEKPLDKIFAIFQLASDRDEYDIVVDYGLDVAYVYTDIVKKYIETYGDLSIVLPRRVQNPAHRLPSWCPDWSSTMPTSNLGNWHDAYPFQVLQNCRQYCAAGLNSQARVRFSNLGRVGRSMYARGWRLDYIRTNSKTAELPQLEPEKSYSLLDTILSFFCLPTTWHIRSASEYDIWYAMYRRSLLPNFQYELRHGLVPVGDGRFTRYLREKHNAFWQILMRATNLYADDAPYESPLYPDWRDERDRATGNPPVLSSVMTPALRDIVREIGKPCINENYTCFFITRDGHMGLGPREMENRDEVCILRGCGFPVVLRRDGATFKIIGAAYVVGFMHGQFVERYLARRRIREEEFEIC